MSASRGRPRRRRHRRGDGGGGLGDGGEDGDGRGRLVGDGTTSWLFTPLGGQLFVLQWTHAPRWPHPRTWAGRPIRSRSALIIPSQIRRTLGAAMALDAAQGLTDWRRGSRSEVAALAPRRRRTVAAEAPAAMAAMAAARQGVAGGGRRRPRRGSAAGGACTRWRRRWRRRSSCRTRPSTTAAAGCLPKPRHHAVLEHQDWHSTPAAAAERAVEDAHEWRAM